MKFNTPQFIITLLASVCLFSQAIAQKEKERIEKYVEQYKELAISEMMRTGVPACITLAQGILETGYGQSDLALNANNHFGIKCKADWNGETILHDDDRKSECFRKYSCVEDSYKDHSDFLRGRANYASLFLLEPTDYSGWANGLKKAGYATSPTYSARLVKLIEDNGLQQYTERAMVQQSHNSTIPVTTPGLQGKQDKSGGSETISTADPAVDIKINEPESVRKATTNPISGLSEAGIYPPGIFKINAARVVFATAGSSLFAIANNNNVPFSKLLEFNDLDIADILKSSQLIFLERKQKRGLNEVHVVANNETLYDICQMEGIQLSGLLEFNHIHKDLKPAVGDKLLLRSKASNAPKIPGANNKEYTSSMR